MVNGCASLVLVPFLGYWTDQGPNPRIRKLFTLFLGAGVYMIGLSLIVIATLSRTDNSTGASDHTTNVSIASSPTVDTSLVTHGVKGIKGVFAHLYNNIHYTHNIYEIVLAFVISVSYSPG